MYLSSDAELLSLKKKRGASQGAAVEFANKKLGESGDFFVEQVHYVLDNCFVTQQAELSLFIYRCFPKGEDCKVQQTVNTQTGTDSFMRKNCNLTPGDGFHHPAGFDHVDHIFQKHAFISFFS